MCYNLCAREKHWHTSVPVMYARGSTFNMRSRIYMISKRRMWLLTVWEIDQRIITSNARHSAKHKHDRKSKCKQYKQRMHSQTCNFIVQTAICNSHIMGRIQPFLKPFNKYNSKWSLLSKLFLNVKFDILHRTCNE